MKEQGGIRMKKEWCNLEKDERKATAEEVEGKETESRHKREDAVEIRKKERKG